MPTAILLFFLGVLSTLFLKELPTLPLFFAISSTSLVFFFSRLIFLRLPAKVGLGFSWTVLQAYIGQSCLPNVYENKTVLIEGFITSIPVLKCETSSFIFHVVKINNRRCPLNVQMKQLNFHYPLHAGESWRFFAKLKRPHTLMNPGCFDSEKQYYVQDISALGTIIPKSKPQLISSHQHAFINQWRENLQNKVLELSQDNDFVGIFLALTLGINTYITPAQWEIFRKTGTNHLVAISGLHIGLVAHFFSNIAGFIWNRWPNAPLLIPTPYIKAFSGMIAATLFSLITGLSPSTQRSLLMVILLLVAIMSNRKITTFRALVFALFGILLLDPFAILVTGFWLSFVAVFLLIYGLNGRDSSSSFFKKWFRPQWIVTVGMIPTLLFFFEQNSLLAIPANIIAIPWISFLVVPTCLLGVFLLMLSEKMGSFLLQLSSMLLQLIWLVLEKLTHLTFLIWHYGFNEIVTVGFTHLAAYISLLPAGLIQKALVILWVLPFLFVKHCIQPYAFEATFFDVGQGLAVIIRTAHHNLIFDTGVKINEDYDMGKAVIIPYLIKQKINLIDALVISHGDNDHIGGAQSVLNFLKVSNIITSVPERFKNYRPLFCKENLKWQWDGVKFEFLSPSNKAQSRGNNASCVLKVSNNRHSILLTGDIEKEAEVSLIQRHARELHSEVLLVPHHGSKTSSTQNFLDKVAPHYAVFSYGYLNRYHHPHQEVVKRYQARGVTLLNTVLSGAITMTLLSNSDMVYVEEFRKIHQKFWHCKKQLEKHED